jgi:hypothetical protein
MITMPISEWDDEPEGVGPGHILVTEEEGRLKAEGAEEKKKFVEVAQ